MIYGQRIDFVQTGSGNTVFSPTSSNTNATPGYKLRAPYSAATLICLGSNRYALVGDLTA